MRKWEDFITFEPDSVNSWVIDPLDEKRGSFKVIPTVSSSPRQQCGSTETDYLVNKPHPAVGRLQDNAPGLKNVRKMNSWLRRVVLSCARLLK